MRLNRLSRSLVVACSLWAATANYCFAQADVVRQYRVNGTAVHMAQYSRNTQELYCDGGVGSGGSMQYFNGDFAISAGRVFTRNGVTIKFPESSGGGVPGSENPISDKDGDGTVAYQVNTQLDSKAAVMTPFIQCLHLPGQVQQLP